MATRRKAQRTRADNPKSELKRLVPREVDVAIIGLLQEDGRMSYSEIAKRLGMTEGTVRNRVLSLIKSNVISISAQALPDAFGFEVLSIIYVNVAPSADINAVARRFAELDELYYVTRTTGRYDLLLAGFHTSLEDFETFMTRHCYGQPDLNDVESAVKLKIYKVQTKWKTFTIGRGPI
jgi:Lrp/AsnC family transcriptional regulator for asnA, asnC and gidA